MLPIEVNPSGPSRSSKTPDLVGGNDEPPNFSIRDYVFKSRSKDIRNSWPFPEQLLQLFSDNGISNLLPPFESSKAVRSRCLTKEVESEHLPKCAINKQISDINGDPNEDIAPERVVNPEETRHLLPGKRRELNVHEEDTPNVKDPMAAKICPVCKLFTSSSNTTLNAHIDGCLSFGRSITTVEFPTPKAKPRKKRLMVDIYSAAPHCTVEELDRRNGTNWAANLSPVAPANDANYLETKRSKLLVSDTVNRGNAGDIYVDSNGTKILILSKSDDSPPSMSRKKLKLKQTGKGFKGSRWKCLMAERKSFKPKHSNFAKDDTEKKKLRIARGFDNEIEAANAGYKTANARKKKEEPSQKRSAEEQVKTREPAIVGHWACSKRSDVSRRHGSKVDIGEGSEKTVENTRRLDVLSKSAKTTDGANKSSPWPCNSTNSKLLWKEDLTWAAGRAGEISSRGESRPRSSKTGRRLASTHRTLPEGTPVSLGARKFTGDDKLVTFRKFQKHRSVSRCGKLQGADEANNDHGTDSVADCDYSLDLDAIPEENEESTSQNESPSQRSEHDQEIGNGITSHDGRENPLTVSEGAQCDQDCNVIVDVESSGSPLSPASAISSPSIGDDKLVGTDKSRPRMTREDDRLRMSAREHPCSRGESLSQESRITNHIRKQMASNLFVKTSALSSFHACRCMESPTESESAITVASSKSSIDSPNPTSRTTTQGASPPILRLMGKDLVVSKEENPKVFLRAPEKTIAFGLPDHYHYERKSNSIYGLAAPCQHWHRPADSYSPARDAIADDDKLHNLGAEPWRNFTYLPQTIQSIDLMDSQRPFSCFPPHNPCANSEGTSFVLPSPSSLYFSSAQR